MRSIAAIVCILCTMPGLADGATRVLLIGKDNDHPPGTHEYMAVCRLLAKCLEQTAEVEAIVSKGWPKDPAKTKNVKAIVLYTANGGDVILAPRVRKQVLALLDQGAGLTAIHWSTGANKINGPQYREILGGWFSRKYAGSRLLVKKLRLEQVDPKHPICRGWRPFDLHDEYYLDLKFSPKAKPVLAVRHQGKRYVVGWVFDRGKGRSFGCVCGHFHRNFAIPSFRKALVNGILWTAGIDVPPEGAPVALRREDLQAPSKR